MRKGMCWACKKTGYSCYMMDGPCKKGAIAELRKIKKKGAKQKRMLKKKKEKKEKMSVGLDYFGPKQKFRLSKINIFIIYLARNKFG